MTKIKLCGLSRPVDIEEANRLKPEYIGFVFAEKSRRYVTPEQAAQLKLQLSPDIKAVGVFVDAPTELIIELLDKKTIDIAQLHGDEDEDYIKQLRSLTDSPIIKAFSITSSSDMESINNSSAHYVLLDSGAGTGTLFNWQLIHSINRPYFLAGGLDPGNVAYAVRSLKPYAVDVSSGIEREGLKDKTKMAAFVSAVRKEDRP